MKLQIIETEDYILAVSNKQPVENYYYDTNINNIRHTGGAEYAIDSSVIQIVAYQPKHKDVPKLNLSLLPDFQQRLLYKDGSEIRKVDLSEKHADLLPETVVGDDVRKLAETKYPINKRGSMWMPSTHECNQVNKQKGFIAGYKAATKVYSEEDVYDILDLGANNKGLRKGEILELFRKSKQPKTPKWFVAEMIKISNNDSKPIKIHKNIEPIFTPNSYFLKSKTTINKEGKKVLVGTYLYE